ncbi:MAG: GNAT family N-acetyltransferase [Pseudomonadota bacterium]
MKTDLAEYYEAIDHTWPAANRWNAGAWIVRDGAGGGKRVSAATLARPSSVFDLRQAESEMSGIQQDPLFMVREGEAVLDAHLEEAGYEIVDPVNIYAAPVGSMARDTPPRLSAFDLWPPLAIQDEIWAEGGIGLARLEIMHRAEGPKTALFGRHEGRPAATGFIAIHNGIAMIHALEVLSAFRRQGVGRNLTRHAALWAQNHSASTIAVLCTTANLAANALYRSMGYSRQGGYHYRALKKGAR